MASWRTLTFAALRRLARGLHLASRGLLHVGAGLLRLDELRALIAQRWQDFGTTEYQVLSGLFTWEREFYDRFLRRGNRLLVVGCGAGRDLIALLRAGYRAEGLEVAPAAAAIARQMLARQGLHAEVRVGRVEDARLDGRYDAIIFSWFCYSYIPARATRVAALTRLHAHLEPGGCVLISYVPAVGRPRRLPVDLMRLAGRVSRSDWSPQATDTVQSGGAGLHFEHLFEAEEIAAEATEAGFAIAFQRHLEDEGTVALAARGAGVSRAAPPG